MGAESAGGYLDSDSGIRPVTARTPLLLALIAGLPAGAVAYLAGIRAWPEIVVPAYFMAHGGILYDTIFFPHTPLLIATLSGLGAVFGFSSILFRSLLAVAMFATAALIVRGLERGRGFAVAATIGVAASIFWEAYMEGLALWPDVLLSPWMLAAALVLERSEESDSRALRRTAGLMLGLAILVKQTSAWVSIAVLVWAVARRKRPAMLAELAAAIALPYVLFAVVWAAVFRTTSHVYWTLAVPLFSSHVDEIRLTGGLGDVYEAIAPLLAVPAVLLLERAAGTKRRSPMGMMVLGTIGMAWPRSDLLHLSSAAGMISFLTARALLHAIGAFALWSRGRLPWMRLAAAALGAATLVSAIGVGAIGGGTMLADAWRGRVLYWDDPLTLTLEKEIAERVPPGGRVFLYDTHRDNLYARTSTLTPGGLYVNSSFWYYFRKGDVGARVADDVARFDGWILFREPDPNETDLRNTALYRLLASHTVAEAPASDGMTWKRIRHP